MNQNNIINLYTNKNRDQTGIENITKFVGFNQQIYLDPAVSGYGFIFVTKPALFIQPIKPSQENSTDMIAYTNMCKDPAFVNFIDGESSNEKDLLIVKSLSYSNFLDVPSLFLPIFTNCATSFSPSDTILDSGNAFQTREGYNMPIPMNTTQSEASGTLTITVTETANLDFYKMIQLWVDYINNISKGIFSANPDMITNNMLDYVSSIYYFMLGPDGRTLKYWCRFTGCFPNTKLSGQFNYQKGSHDIITLDIPFSYTLKEEMNPQILEDFNLLSLNLVTSTFSDTSYSEFITRLDNLNTVGYNSYSTSAILSKTNLQSNEYMSRVTSNSRDPLILYETGNTNNIYNDSTTGKYILSFGNDTLNNSLLNSLVEDPDAFSYSIFDDFSSDES